MLAHYHISILTHTIGQYFTPSALQRIIAANLGQDSAVNLLRPRLHFDNCLIAEGLAYIEEQHEIIARSDDPGAMRAAFGRLSHTAQDFYSHSNYVDLWLKSNGGLEGAHSDDINGLDSVILTSPDLRTAYFYIWRDFIYYVPLLMRFTRKYFVFPRSHEAVHLDDESRGPKFHFAIAAAKQRTLAEYQRAVQTLGPARAAIFHDRMPKRRKR